MLKSIAIIEAPSILGSGPPVQSTCRTRLSVPACSRGCMPDTQDVSTRRCTVMLVTERQDS